MHILFKLVIQTETETKQLQKACFMNNSIQELLSVKRITDFNNPYCTKTKFSIKDFLWPKKWPNSQETACIVAFTEEILN